MSGFEPLSFAGGPFVGGVSVPLPGIDRQVEVRACASGFAQLLRWLGGADLLVLKADRREPLVVLPPRLAAEIAAAAESGPPASAGDRR
jgi:hypothetical protein